MENDNRHDLKFEETEDYEGGQASKWDIVVKAAITSGILLFLWLSEVNQYEVSAEVVALIVIAIVPWLSSILESVDLPGGGGLKFKKQIETQRKQLAAQQKIVNELVIYSMSQLIFNHLDGLKQANDKDGEYLFQGDLDAFRRDLRFLRDHGYLNHFHIRPLQEGQNLVGIATLTPAGNFLVDLRQALDRRKRQEKEKLASHIST